MRMEFSAHVHFEGRGQRRVGLVAPRLADKPALKLPSGRHVLLVEEALDERHTAAVERTGPRPLDTSAHQLNELLGRLAGEDLQSLRAEFRSVRRVRGEPVVFCSAALVVVQ